MARNAHVGSIYRCIFDRTGIEFFIIVSVLYIVFKVNLNQVMALVFNPVYIGVGNSNFNV
jgi:hypothetical protein